MNVFHAVSVFSSRPTSLRSATKALSGSSTVARWLVLAVLMLLPSLASAQEPCSEDPRYLLVTVVSGEIYAGGEAILDLAVGPYMLDLCGGEAVSLSSHVDGAEVVIQYDAGLIQRIIVSETLTELCRAMSSCVVVTDAD